MELNNFIGLVENLTKEFSNNSLITGFITNWRQLRQQAGNDPNRLKDLVVPQLESLKTGLPKLSQLSEEDTTILKSFNIEKFIGKIGQTTISNLQKQIQTNPANTQALIQSFINELNQAKTNPTQLFTQLQPFKTEIPNIEKNEGIIEIIFNGKVKIVNISDGKEQFNDWFLIIDGYAHLFDKKREDFEIINISKNSPTTIKIKTTIEIAAAILGIIASVYSIEQQYASDRIMVEKLKARPLVEDSLHQQFLKEAEERLTKNVEREINRLVDHKIEEQKIDAKSRGDIVNSFQKGVKKQYNFVINGGEVKFYLGEDKENEKTKELEAKKEEIKLLKDRLENIKTLNESNTSSKTSETDSTETKE